MNSFTAHITGYPNISPARIPAMRAEFLFVLFTAISPAPRVSMPHSRCSINIWWMWGRHQTNDGLPRLQQRSNRRLVEGAVSYTEQESTGWPLQELDWKEGLIYFSGRSKCAISQPLTLWLVVPICPSFTYGRHPMSAPLNFLNINHSTHIHGAPTACQECSRCWVYSNEPNR